MLTIGDFARLGGVSVRMLRHYDRIGLLRPAQVDERTGRRSYAPGQLARLTRVVQLTALGFNLAQVSILLEDATGAVELRRVLRLREAELERQVHERQHALDRVRARLRLAEAASEDAVTSSTTADPQVTVTRAAPLRVAALTARAPDTRRASVGPVVEGLLGRACDLMDAAGRCRTDPVARCAPPVAGARHEPGTAVMVTAGFVVPSGEVPGLEVATFPAADLATVVRRGPMADIHLAYQVLAGWAPGHGHAHRLAAGCWRERYLEAAGEDQSEWLVEVQLELS